MTLSVCTVMDCYCSRIFFHFPVSEGYNRADNGITDIVIIITSVKLESVTLSCWTIYISELAVKLAKATVSHIERLYFTEQCSSSPDHAWQYS